MKAQSESQVRRLAVQRPKTVTADMVMKLAACIAITSDLGRPTAELHITGRNAFCEHRLADGTTTVTRWRWDEDREDWGLWF